MRSFLTFAACSLLCLLPSCSEKAAPATEPPAADPVPVEEPSPEPTDVPKEPEPPSDPLVLDLGEVTAGTDVSFEIPEGALGFNITIEGKALDFDPDAPYGIERITAPNGKVVHDDFTPSGGTNPTSYAQLDTIATASVPQGEGVPTKLEGTWKMRVGVYGAAAKKPKVKAKVRVQSSGDGTFHGGTLDLHLHVPDGLELDGRVIDAAKAKSDPGIQERVERFFALTSELLGIEQGEVVIETEAASYQELDGVDELLQGFSISSGQKDGSQVLHVLMTNVIAENGEPFAAGISPGIPGAANVFGRNVSSIIVTTSESADQDVLVMIHEAGHFFGLNHTTEFDGQSSDPLSDTPTCSNISYDPYDLMECPDRANVMFAAGALDGPVTLSAKQKRVYRGSPIYKALGSGAAMSRALRPGRTARPSLRASLARSVRISGSSLSPIERELGLGFCGLNEIDAAGMVRRHGRAEAVRQLRAAAHDADLRPFARGRANLALKLLGEH